LGDIKDAIAVFLPILGVSAVILCAYWATKILTGRRALHTGQRRVRVLERVPLARDASLALISVDDKTYLMSVGAGRVELICAADAENPKAGTGEGGFAALVSTRMNRSKTGAAGEDGEVRS
jgi:flagellar biogenesis protein FliO